MGGTHLLRCGIQRHHKHPHLCEACRVSDVCPQGYIDAVKEVQIGLPYVVQLVEQDTVV